MKKKILSMLMAMTLAVTVLAGCGGSSSNGSEAPAASETQEEAKSEDTAEASTEAGGKSYSFGILQLIEHPALDAASQGFQDAITEKLGAENVSFSLQNAQGEQANCASIASQFVADNVDLILANATLALQTSSAATKDIPILGTSITDYATALDMANWDGVTGTNISGTSDLAPLDEQENMLLELFPDVKKVGIVYCSAEANSEYQATVFGQNLDADGIAWDRYPIADSNDIQAVLTTAVGECDVLYIPTDNTLANNTEAVNNIALPAGIPIIAGEEGICGGCGVATLSISYYDLGYRTGEMAVDILENGADISSMEIAYAPNVTKKYNAANCEALGIQIPSDYEAIEQ